MLPVQFFAALEEMENDRREQIRRQNIERRNLRDSSDPFSMNETLFISTFRLNKEMVRYLILELAPHMSSSNHLNAVRPDVKIFTALNFFATGGYQRQVGQNFMLSVSQRSVSNYVEDVSFLIVNHLAGRFIKFPRVIEDKQSIKSSFMQHTRFPGVIGAIDCTHIAIIAPAEEEHNYINRKGYHSKNVQIICDYDLRILNINPRYAGATHDAFIWRNSTVRQELENCHLQGDRNSWLLGDSGYPQEPWLMTPVINAAVGTPEDRYNRRHSSARNCIERCNGVLKTRFRCLLGERVLRYGPEKTGFIIIACAVLHNLCINARLNLNEDPVVEQLDNDHVVLPPPIGGNNIGFNSRNDLIERYFR